MKIISTFMISLVVCSTSVLASNLIDVCYLKNQDNTQVQFVFNPRNGQLNVDFYSQDYDPLFGFNKKVDGSRTVVTVNRSTGKMSTILLDLGRSGKLHVNLDSLKLKANLFGKLNGNFELKCKGRVSRNRAPASTEFENENNDCLTAVSKAEDKLFKVLKEQTTKMSEGQDSTTRGRLNAYKILARVDVGKILRNYCNKSSKAITKNL